MNSRIKALFFDIDGTLVSFKTHQIPQSAVDAISRAKANGVKVFIATGRPKALITNLDEISDFIDGYVTTNGAYCFAGKEVISCKPIPAEDVAAVMCKVDEWGVSCIVVGTESVLAHNRTPQLLEVEKMLATGSIPFDGASMEKLHKEGIVQLTPFFSVEQESEVMKEVPSCISGRWSPLFTDITVDGADKGKGIDAVARYFGFEISETMAFGDGGNDIAMLRHAGIGIAMGNANDEVKSHATYVTTHIDSDGIAKALRHFSII